MGSLLSSDVSVAQLETAIFDLDGTLLNPEHVPTVGTIATVRKLHEKGITVAIATGRSAPALFPVVAALGIPRVPVVCYNGAGGLMCAYDSATQKVSVEEEIFKQPLSAAATRAALDFGRGLGFVLHYYAGDEILVEREDEQTRRYRDLTGVQQRVVASLDGQQDPYKILVMCGEERIDEVHEAALREVGEVCHVIRGAPPFFVELLDPAVNKGDGVAKMMQQMGRSLETCAAFGDGDNDLEMVKMVGYGVAMANARDIVKQSAKAVTKKTNADDGLAAHLEEMLEEGMFGPAM